MSERKSPESPDRDPMDELFDRDFLSDSDSEFLTELDRVLADDDSTAPPSAEDRDTSAEDFELDLEIEEEPADAGESAPLPGPSAETPPGVAPEEDVPATPEPDSTSLEEVIEQPAFELADDIYTPSGPTSIDDESAAEADHTADQVMDSGFPGPRPQAEEEPRHSVEEATQPVAADADPGDFISRWDNEVHAPEETGLDWEAPAAPEAAPPPSEPMSPAPEEPADATPPSSVPFREPGAETPVTAIAAGAGAAVATATGAPEGSVPPAAHPQPGHGGAWLGATALLALVGLMLGSAGLWQAQTIGERVSRLGAHLRNDSAATSSPAAAIVSPPASVDSVDDARTAELSRRMDRLESALSALGMPPGTDEAERSDLLEQQLTSLRDDLEALQAQVQSLPGDPAAQGKQAATPAPRNAAPPPSPGAGPTEPTAPAPHAAQIPTDTGPPPPAEGGWAVNLVSFRPAEKAEREAGRLRAEGIPARVRTVVNKGTTWHRVLVDGFATAGEAKTYADRVRTHPGLESAWVGRN